MIFQWRKVESEFAKEYGLTLEEVFTLSWRRFRVLFISAFTWPEPDEEDPESLGPATGAISKTVDWSKAKDAPDMLAPFRGAQIEVGKGTIDG